MLLLLLAGRLDGAVDHLVRLGALGHPSGRKDIVRMAPTKTFDEGNLDSVLFALLQVGQRPFVKDV